MDAKKIKIGMLFPLRKEHDQLNKLCQDFPIEIVNTPYIETNELRSDRGLNHGVNPGLHAEPEIDDASKVEWQNCDAIVSMDLPSHPQSLFPNLSWFQGVSAGYDHIDSSALAEMGVIQTNARGIASASISEFVFARLLQVLKDLRMIDQQQSEKIWKVKFGSEAYGKTIGIVGLGSIGREVAVRARAFGMTVLAVKKNPSTEGYDEAVDQIFPVSELDLMIGMSDVVVMAAPANQETRDMFNRERFFRMKPGSIFCNIARGMHVVEDDLVQALNEDHLRAAILDVTRSEPLPVDSPMWTAKNMYLSPHCSVSFDSYEENAVTLLVENAQLFIEGKSMRNVVPSY